ncbi:hypothetical protein QM012_000160 [Aureobasidium pullulans]|uniref:Uncharacterized protein n=1 Tax=Aureobasidium pullulans TaxID=5580 RepID=A0ABR0TW01_AURPU
MPNDTPTMWFAAFVLSLLSIAMAASTTTDLTKLVKLCQNTFPRFQEVASKRKSRPFPLLALPPEVRLQIYRYALPQQQTIILTKPPASYCPFPPSSAPLAIYVPALLIRNEAQELFYANNAFVLNIDVSKTLLRIPTLLELLDNGSDGGILAMIKDFRLRVGGNVMVDVCGPVSRRKRYGGRVLVARVPEDEITGFLRAEENIGKCVERALDESEGCGVSSSLIKRLLDEVFWNWEESGCI